MGLATTHNCWHGSYGTFNWFRFNLGKQIGIDLQDYIEYSGNGKKSLNDIHHNLIPLFNHSDCEGILTPDECKKIVKGLNNVLNNYNPDLVNYGDADYFKNKLIQFKNGCKKAIEANENVEFH